MEEKEISTEKKDSLKSEDLENVSGGCIFWHSWNPVSTGFSWNGHHYHMYTCEECGYRKYEIDWSTEISREEYERAKRGEM